MGISCVRPPHNIVARPASKSTAYRTELCQSAPLMQLALISFGASACGLGDNRTAVVGSQLEQIVALQNECKAEDITIAAEDVARMRDCAAIQRHMKVKLSTETVPAMIEALFTSFCRKGSRVLKKTEYASFVTHVAGYEKLTDSQWVEECALVGASPKAGIDLEQFTKLYSEYGRKIREDYGKVFVLP